MNELRCRSCQALLETTFLDLGDSPLANSYLKASDLGKPEVRYPLHVRICRKCLLVQLPVVQLPEEIFSEYAYFSSFSEGWLQHSRAFADHATTHLGIDRQSLVVELASNDGYLLQFFQEKEISVLGIEPARNVAEAALRKGIPTVTEFFGEPLARRLADEGVSATLIVANNVLAHVPDVNDFVKGIKILLADKGVVSIEFPHLLNLIEQCQFDTIYHEHFSYFSLRTAGMILSRHGLEVVDVEALPTHGGSLRLYAQHAQASTALPRPSGALTEMRLREKRAGLDRLDGHLDFGPRVVEAKRKLVDCLGSLRRQGARIAAYGAPAKGNTLLNYCGIDATTIEYTVDRNPHKQGCWLPGSRIPIFAPDHLREIRPDYVVILPWNIKEEIMEQMQCIRDGGGRFIIPMPEPTIV